VALGARLLGHDGTELPASPAALAGLARLDTSGLDPRLAALDVQIASDVTNPLLGPEGASAVFGPQKGATASMVAQLDAALAVLAPHLARVAGRDVAATPGAGAAGGLGAAFLTAFPSARLRPGVELVLEAAHFAEAVQEADVVFTGEGSVDGQTVHGKTPFGVARAARHAGVPVVVFAGRVGPGAEALYDHGVGALVPITRDVGPLADALVSGPVNLEAAAAMVCRLLALPTAQERT
jgi:glycerate kinase